MDLRFAIEATVSENTRIRYIPSWNVFSIRFIGLIKEASNPSVVIVSITTTIIGNLCRSKARQTAIMEIITEIPRAPSKGKNTPFLNIPE